MLEQSRARRVARAAVVVAALVVAVVIGRRYAGELHRLADVSPVYPCAMAAVYLLTRLVNAEAFARSLARLGHAVPRGEAFVALLVQSLINLVVPHAGMAAPAGYMRLRRGVPLADFGAVQVLPMFLAETFCVGALGLACLGVLAATGGAPWRWDVAALFAAVCVGCVVAAACPWPTFRGTHAIARFLGRLALAQQRLGDARLYAGVTALHLVSLTLRAARIWLSFRAVGVTVNPFAASAASLMSDLMLIVGFTPGALGFREAAFVFASGVLRTTGEIALAAALLDRLVVSLCTLAVGSGGLMLYRSRRPAASNVSVAEARGT